MENSKFTAFEKKILMDFLSDLENHMNNAGCNDYDVPNTPEGRALIVSAFKHSYSPEDAQRELAEAFEHSGNAILTIDSIILGYLKDKLQRIL